MPAFYEHFVMAGIVYPYTDGHGQFGENFY